jgi:N-glycosidase YbiA
MDNTIIVGDVFWLRNDYYSDIVVNGITYPSVEHAYQAAKFNNIDIKQQIADVDISVARSIGRSNHCDLRNNWDDARRVVMTTLIRYKFSSEELRKLLVKTGNDKIIMNGYDEFWGTGRSGQGENVLGEILMEVRREIQLMKGSLPYDTVENKPPTIKDAILNNPDQALAQACHNLFIGVKELLTLVDTNDFDAALISRRTGVSIATAEDAIKKLQSMLTAINSLDDLLKTDNNDSYDDDNDDDDDDKNDDWLTSFD